MPTLKQNLSVDGQVLSNTDPDMSIKLDDHPVVQIGSIQASSITYKFLTEVSEETTYELNLTFTYKGTNKLVVPLKFTHSVEKPNLVVTNSPISASMWERGNTAPFTLTLDGTNVTGRLTNLKIGDNEYVKPDSAGTDVWEILYSKPTGFDETVSFTYDFVNNGKTWEYTSEGTFKLPAWDGVAFWLRNAQQGGPLPVPVRLEKGKTVTLNMFGVFKDVDYFSTDNFVRLPSKDDLLDGAVTFTEGESDETTGREITLGVTKTGDLKPKIAYAMVSPLGGYPKDTDNLTVAYWEPQIDAWESSLTIDPDSHAILGYKGDKFNINPNLKLDGTPVAPNDPRVSYQVDPTGTVRIAQLTDTNIVFEIIDESTMPVVREVTVTATLGELSVSAVLTVNVSIPELEVKPVNVPNIISGYKDDTVLVKLNILYGGKSVPGNDPGVTYSSTNTGSITIVQGDADGVIVKLTRATDSQVTVNSGIGVTYKGQTVNVSIGVTHNPVLVLTLDTPSISGETGDEIKVMMTVTNRGVVVPLDTHPLTITYDPGEILAPTEIESDGVLSTIEKVVTETTSYEINVTADFNDLKSAAKKLTVAVSPKFKIVVTQDLPVELVPFESTRLYFTLDDQNGNPLVGMKSSSLNVTTDPRSGFVVQGYGSNMGADPDVPGRYYVSMTPGETTGTVTIHLVVHRLDEEKTYELDPLIYTNPGSPVIATPTPAVAGAVLDQVTDINFTLTKAISSNPTKPAVGRVIITSVTGAGILGKNISNTDTPGTYNFGIKSKGEIGKVTVTGTYNDNSTASIYPDAPFSFEFNYDRVIVDAKVEKITQSADLVGAQTNEIKFKVFDAANNPLVGLKLYDMGVSSLPVSTSILVDYRKTITEPEPGTYSCSIDLGHVKGSIGIKCVLKSDANVIYIVPDLIYTAPGTPIIASLTPQELIATAITPVNGNISISQKRFGATNGIATFPTKLSNPVITGPLTLVDGFPSDFNTGTIPVKLKGTGDVGDATLTFDVSDDVDSALGSGTVTIKATPVQAATIDIVHTEEPLAPMNEGKYFIQFENENSEILDNLEVVSVTGKMIAGNNNTFISAESTLTPTTVNGEKGYYISYKSGWRPGTVRFEVTVKYGNKDYPSMIIDVENPGQPIEAVMDKTSIPVGNTSTSIGVQIAMKRDLDGTLTMLTGKLRNTAADGIQSSYTRTPSATTSTNKWTFNSVRTDGTATPMAIHCTFTEDGGMDYTVDLTLPKQ